MNREEGAPAPNPMESAILSQACPAPRSIRARLLCGELLSCRLSGSSVTIHMFQTGFVCCASCQSLIVPQFQAVICWEERVLSKRAIMILSPGHTRTRMVSGANVARVLLSCALLPGRRRCASSSSPSTCSNARRRRTSPTSCEAERDSEASSQRDASTQRVMSREGGSEVSHYDILERTRCCGSSL